MPVLDDPVDEHDGRDHAGAARPECVNTKLRLLTRIAYGFRNTDNLIALCLLDHGGHCPPLPGRTLPE